MTEAKGWNARGRLLLVALCLWLSAPGWGQDRPTSVIIAPPYAKLWVDSSATVSAEALAKTLDEVDQQEERPEGIVVIIHGYDMSQQQSWLLYEPLALGVKSGLYPGATAIVGLQWDSGGGGFDYFSTLARARQIGRGPVRQLLLALRERYPDTPVSVLAHSMGCEMTVAALVPELTYRDNAPEGPAFEPERELTLAMAAFAGSDLDYDMWTQYPEAARQWFQRCRLTWSTLTDPSGPGDKVLSLRARVRGKAAGALMPTLPEDVADVVIPSRGLYLDGENVPTDHELNSYFSAARLSRILAALNFVTVPGTAEPAELASLREVVEADDDDRLLVTKLDSPYAGAALAALWRLERLNCGNSRHLADGTLSHAAELLADSPQAIWREQAHSQCVTLQKAQFPTARMMTRAGAPPWARPRWAEPAK